jgi:hypothetical protein
MVSHNHDDPPAPDDFELSDLEDDAFLPNGRTARRRSKGQSALTSWMPPRMRNFVENFSRIKVSLEPPLKHLEVALLMSHVFAIS